MRKRYYSNVWATPSRPGGGDHTFPGGGSGPRTLTEPGTTIPFLGGGPPTLHAGSYMSRDREKERERERERKRERETERKRERERARGARGARGAGTRKNSIVSSKQ